VRIGIDLGGTKIEGVGMEGSAVVARRRVATPRGSYDGTLDTIARIVAELEQETGCRCTVGVGMPGTISRATGLVKNANSTWLNGRAFDRDLSERLRREVKFSNDANCFALSEAIDGAAAGAHVVFGVIVGTGTGGGVVIDRQVIEGRNGVGGEWGHNALPWPEADELPGPPCYCGHHGCIETFLSGPALAAEYQRTTGDAARAEDVVARAARGDAAAADTLARYERRMARALASIINVIDPDVIVLGGGLSNIDRFYEAVPRLWGEWVFSDVVDTPLVKAVHGDSSGVRGAARLWDSGI
jgi:fructokinase